VREVRILRATDDTRPEWDAFIEARPEADVLQTWAWGDVQAGAGERPARLVARAPGGTLRGVAQALVRPTWFGRSVLYVAHGPVWEREARDGDAVLRALVAGLRRLAREERGIVVKLDPRGDGLDDAGLAALDARLRALELRPARHDLQARTTRIVDLLDGGDQLRKTWDKDARNLVRRSTKEGVETRVLRAADRGAIGAFQALLDETAQRGEFRSHSVEFLWQLAIAMADRDGWYLAEARQGDRLVGGMVTLRIADRAYYLYGASTRDPALKNANAGYATMAASMAALAADRVRTLDLWGVAEPGDETPAEWAGFSAFKRRFGGRPVRHPGTFDLVTGRGWFAVRDIRERARAWLAPGA
jgi:lipid II:glycine glycyltransferase (peptidoglycan interpeptide bridge formation enzyme)